MEPEIVREKPKPTKREKDEDRSVLVFMLLAALGLGLGIMIKGLRDARPARLLVRPREQAEAEAPESQAPEAHLLRPKDGEADADVSAALQFLEHAAATPIGPEFAKEFMSDPDLRKLWDGFGQRLRQEPDGAVRDFALALAHSQKFGALIVRFGPQPGFKDLVDEAARIPAVGDALASRENGPAPSDDGLAPPPDAQAQSQPDATNVGPALAQVDDARGDKDVVDRHTLWGKMDEPDRNAVMKALESGGGSAMDACRAAGRVAQCQAALRACKQDRQCDASEFEGG